MSFVSRHDWKQPSYEGLTPSPIEWAQMAAYLDGEGSILINPRRGRATYPGGAGAFYLRITVANTDVRLPVWIKQIFGGSYKDANTEAYYVGKNWKRAYHWNAGGSRAAWILHNCHPYFVMKAEQADLGMQLQDSIDTRTSKFLPQETIEERREIKRKLLVIKARGVRLEPSQVQRISEVS